MPASTRSLDNPVQSVRGVGPRGGELLGRLGIATVWDLLRHVPRRYEDRTRIAAISDLRMGEMAVARGVVRAAETVNTRRSGMQITRVVIGDESGTAELVFFRQPFLLRRFQEMLIRRRAIVVYGQVRESGSGRPAFEHPEWEEVLPDEDLLSSGRIVPVYPLGEGLTQKWLRRMMASALDTHLDLIDDALPAGLMEMHRLTPITTAFRDVHLPESMDAALAARRRLVFDEFFVLQTGLALRRLGRAEETEVAVIPSTRADVERIISDVLPFEPTTDQTSAIREIAADMASGRQMNRLLHGDVGSGKTAVAVVALALVARAGLQAAVMAPTEILAQQQASVLRRWLEPAGIRIGLSTGSTGTRSRARLREELAEGTTSVVVGTHALIEDDVRFKSLGLVVIDEQHRFGVLQRQALQAKGTAPHVLVMSATPIPRTLTLTLYGDLDVTALRQSPPGRGSLKTHWKRPEAAAGVYAALATLLAQGKQAYVVCPLVEESDKLEAAAAKQHAERIQRDMLPGCRVGLLHGQMPGEAKEACLEAFRLGELDVLVSTTVIEVGIDVPNAAVMVIENADRFGLAQLHQLRGRVGRGSDASYCVLIADPTTDDGRRRMQVMTATRDGFRIAEEDLRLRGPGECMGTKQSGVPTFFFGDIVRDEDVLIETRQAAARLVESDPGLALDEHRLLRAAVDRQVGSLELVKVS